MLKRQKSILFIAPDYHTSFIYRDELRKRGWKSDVYVPRTYPEHMLYANDVIREPRLHREEVFFRVVNVIVSFIHFHFVGLRYRYHIHYGALQSPTSLEDVWYQSKTSKSGFHMGLAIAKRLGRKIVFVPSGCRDEDLKSSFLDVEQGRICNNCGFFDRCHDSNIEPFLARARRYASLSVGNGFFTSRSLKTVVFRYKVIDLALWSCPALSLKDGEKIRVQHSHSLQTRQTGGRNIKGTPAIREAMSKIEKEFPRVEFEEVTNVPPAEMRSRQADAHIVIDQLIYGHWGSTAIEAMALGKVVICYLRPEWEQNFRRHFPDVGEIPVVSATPETVYEVVRTLIQNPNEIVRLGRAARDFAERQFNVTKNVTELVRALNEIA